MSSSAQSQKSEARIIAEHTLRDALPGLAAAYRKNRGIHGLLIDFEEPQMANCAHMLIRIVPSSASTGMFQLMVGVPSKWEPHYIIKRIWLDEMTEDTILEYLCSEKAIGQICDAATELVTSDAYG